MSVTLPRQTAFPFICCFCLIFILALNFDRLKTFLPPMVMISQSEWQSLDDEALLELRVSELGLKMEGRVAGCVDQLYAELRGKGLSLMPRCHIGDEWFCPEGCAAIFIPFYLFDDRLRKLERKMLMEIEGGTRDECMKLLRHEAGHAYSYAYKVQRRKKWQKHFGLASQAYPETYRPRRYSKSFVLHLDDWYAQMHPDEDWAETFAVWLTPKSNWQNEYAGWPALRKLEYVDELMGALVGKKPKGLEHYRPSVESSLRIKLRTYYRRKQKTFAESFPDYYDDDLHQLFKSYPSRNESSAGSFIMQNRKQVVNAVSQWTREPKYRVNELLEEFIERTEELSLVSSRDHSELLSGLVSYTTSLVMNQRFTGRYKHSR